MIIEAGRLIDGRGNVEENRALVIEGKYISGVLPLEAVDARPDDEVIDARSQTVMPGLIDCHVHTRSGGYPEERASAPTATIPDFTLRSLTNAQKDLEAGFTTIRDLASIGFADVALRDAFERGDFAGPRMRVAGHGLTMWGGHMHRNHQMRPGLDTAQIMGVVNTVDQAKEAARYQISRGVDFIKFNTAGSHRLEDGSITIHKEMDYEMLAAAVEEAKKVEIMTAAHCHGGEGATDTIRAGVDTLEHGHFLTDEHLELMLEHGTIFVPTLSPNEKLYERGREALGGVWDRWEWLETVMEIKTDTLARAIKAGVPVAAGSDAGTNYNHHGENAREMEFMVRRGMTPMEAIVAMTYTAARATNLGRWTGSLEAGKWADVVVVSKNPLDDIEVLNDRENFLRIIKDGKVMIDRTG
ncbi:MAG: amidohydrolase family protein [Clostridia bacterium]